MDGRIGFRIPDLPKNEVDDEINHALYASPAWPIDAPLQHLLRGEFNRVYAETMFAKREELDTKTMQEKMRDQVVVNCLSYLLTAIKEEEDREE